MNKIELNFEDYNEEDKEIYEWLSTKEDYLDFIKATLSKEMMEEKSRQVRKKSRLTDKDIEQIANEFREIFGEADKKKNTDKKKKLTSKDLDKIFDNEFWK